MRQIRSEITIDASAERVWQVLTGFDAYPEWNPFITSIAGDLKSESRLKIYAKPPGKMGMTFKPVVLSVQANRELRWMGHLLVPGIFDGQPSFAIDPIEENRVTFVQGERFTGVLVPFFGLIGLLDATLRGFEEMNRALKERAEGLT